MTKENTRRRATAAKGASVAANRAEKDQRTPSPFPWLVLKRPVALAGPLTRSQCAKHRGTRTDGAPAIPAIRQRPIAAYPLASF
jgi:hypothetical protein